MYTEKGKLGIGHRINKMAHEAQRLGAEPVILSTEGNDLVSWVETGQPTNAVALQASAVDQEVAGKIAGPRFGRPTIRRLGEARDFRAGHHAAAHNQKVLTQGLADGGVVNNALLRHVQGSHTNRMRFHFPQPFAIEPAQPGEAVGPSTGFELVQAWDFAGVDGHNHLAADFMRNVFFAAVGGHGPDALDGQTRLERARPVIKPGVEYPAVVGALMGPDRGFLLE